MRNAYTILLRRPEGKNHVGNLSVDRRIILKWIMKVWTGFNLLRIGLSGGYIVMIFAFHKNGKFPDQLSD
jgi:hypothetical protein